MEYSGDRECTAALGNACAPSRCPEPAPAKERERVPHRHEQKPHRDGKHQRKCDALGGECEGRHPVVQRCAHQARIGVQREVGTLPEQASLQRIYRSLQLLHSCDQRADDGAFGMKRGIAALEVVADQPLDVTLVVLLSEALPRLEVEPRLIEPAAEPLAILCDEPWHEPACDHGAYEEQSIEQSFYEWHGRHSQRGAASLHRRRGAANCPSSGQPPGNRPWRTLRGLRARTASRRHILRWPERRFGFKLDSSAALRTASP